MKLSTETSSCTSFVPKALIGQVEEAASRATTLELELCFFWRFEIDKKPYPAPHSTNSFCLSWYDFLVFSVLTLANIDSLLEPLTICKHLRNLLVDGVCSRLLFGPVYHARGLCSIEQLISTMPTPTLEMTSRSEFPNLVLPR